MKKFKDFVTEKKELTPAQKKHLDVDNDNDIDAKDFAKLRAKKAAKDRAVGDDD